MINPASAATIAAIPMPIARDLRAILGSMTPPPFCCEEDALGWASVSLYTSELRWDVCPSCDRTSVAPVGRRFLGRERHDVVVRITVLRRTTPPPLRVPDRTNLGQNFEDGVIGLVAKDVNVPHRPSVPHGHSLELEWKGI